MPEGECLHPNSAVNQGSLNAAATRLPSQHWQHNAFGVQFAAVFKSMYRHLEGVKSFRPFSRLKQSGSEHLA